MPRSARLLIAAFLLLTGVSVVLHAVSTIGGTLPGPLPLFPADNWWNLDVSGLPLDPNSDAFMNFVGRTRQSHPDFGGNVSTNSVQIYGYPYAIVDSTVPLKTVQFDYSDESDGVDHSTNQSFPFYPIPDEAITQPHWVEDGEPGNQDLRGSSDRHMLIVDKDHRKLFELFSVFYDGAQWHAGSGAEFDLDSNARRPDGWTSADAAGLAMLPGLVRYDEVYGTSEINHAFRVTVRSTNGYVYPASHRAGSTTGALPMGARLRLKQSKDISTYPAEMQRVFRAMKKYGLIVADNGSDLYVSGTYDTRWNNDILNPAFHSLTGNDFEVVQLGIRPAVTVTADSVTPSTGSGTTQTFTLKYSDTAGATDLSQAWVWINATQASSAASSCLAYYTRATNVLNLLNDAGTSYVSAVVGTSGTLQNSQCAISLGGTTVSTSGNTLTLNAAVTFKAYAGAKNVYMYASANGGTNSGWQARGTWTAVAGTGGSGGGGGGGGTSGPGTPTADSVTPATGSGNSQSFALQYSDTGGATDLAQAWVWINATMGSSAASSCLAYYTAATNVLNLLNDAGTAYTSAAIGTGTTLQNSQCAVNLATSTAVASGNSLTLNLAVSFKTYSGAKNVYLYASTKGGANSGWQSRGTWTAVAGSSGGGGGGGTSGPGTPTSDSVAPATGSGNSQSFALQYSDTGGAADLAQAWVWINATFASSAGNSCLAYYTRAANTLNLLNDGGTGYTSAAVGATGTLQNSQCSIDLGASTAATSGNSLTLNLAVTFKTYSGAKNVYMYASTNSGWQTRGTWTAVAGSGGSGGGGGTSGPGTPTADSVTPATGSGASQAFALQYSDTGGAADLAQAWVWINGSFASSAANSCLAYYARSTNVLNLLNDAGTGYTSAAVGTTGTLQNSQCAISLASTTATTSGNVLTLNLAVSFKTYAGAKNVYMYASTNGGANSGWQTRGTWTAVAGGAGSGGGGGASGPGTPTADAVAPATGSGTSQTFALQYSDTGGATDLAQAWVWINATFASSAANSCLAYYDRATNMLNLLNDAATGYVSAAIGSTGTLQSTQCAINLASSTVTISGNTLTLNLAVTFRTYSGAKNIYLYASTAGGSNSGWQTRGSWTVP